MEHEEGDVAYMRNEILEKPGWEAMRATQKSTMPSYFCDSFWYEEERSSSLNIVRSSDLVFGWRNDT